MTEDFKGKRVAIHARVSTKRQANDDLSVPDQIAYGERWVSEQSATLIHTYIEAGRAPRGTTARSSRR